MASVGLSGVPTLDIDLLEALSSPPGNRLAFAT
ncbi:hypothetical protein AB7M17_003162 [Bradyrhizobium sp. USDA 377]